MQARPKRMAPESLAWQQLPGSAWQQRPVFSRLVWLLAWQLVLQPAWQRQVWLLVSLRQVLPRWLAWQRRQVLQSQVLQQQSW